MCIEGEIINLLSLLYHPLTQMWPRTLQGSSLVGVVVGVAIHVGGCGLFLKVHVLNLCVITATHTVVSRLQRLPWTSLYGKTEKDSSQLTVMTGQLFLAVVMGYVYKDVPTVDVYCAFVFSNGVRMCSNKPVTRKHPTRCFTPSFPAQPFV